MCPGDEWKHELEVDRRGEAAVCSHRHSDSSVQWSGLDFCSWNMLRCDTQGNLASLVPVLNNLTGMLLVGAFSDWHAGTVPNLDGLETLRVLGFGFSSLGDASSPGLSGMMMKDSAGSILRWIQALFHPYIT